MSKNNPEIIDLSDSPPKKQRQRKQNSDGHKRANSTLSAANRLHPALQRAAQTYFLNEFKAIVDMNDEDSDEELLSLLIQNQFHLERTVSEYFEKKTAKSPKVFANDDSPTDAAEEFDVVFDKFGLLVDKHPAAENDSNGWVWVRRKGQHHYTSMYSKADELNMISEYNQMDRPLDHGIILNIAKKYDILVGKWLAFAHKDNPGVTWKKIRNAILEGKLGDTAKISSQPDNSGFMVICVYVNDFTDKQKVLQVRQSLNKLSVGSHGKRPLNFKLDAYTILDVYSGDKKKFRSTIYSCGGANDPGCTILKSVYPKCTKLNGCPSCYPSCCGAAT